MAKLDWEWTLGPETVRATLDTSAHVESVHVGARLISRSAPGGNPSGHVVPLAAGGEARVYFNPPTRECSLAVNGAPVPPSRITTKGMSVLAILGIVAAVGFVFLGTLVAVGVYAVRKYQANVKTAAEAPFSQKYTSPNGFLVAHYPADFAAEVRGESSLQIARGPRDDSVLLMSVRNPVSRDPAELSRIILKPILDAFSKDGDGEAKTTSEGAGQCLGHPGYTTSGTGRIGIESVVTWSCTFVDGGHGYSIFVSVNDVFADDMPLLHRIVDATELTAPATPPPPSPPPTLIPRSVAPPRRSR